MTDVIREMPSEQIIVQPANISVTHHILAISGDPEYQTLTALSISGFLSENSGKATSELAGL